MVYSYCGLCFDAATGVPPPENWKALEILAPMVSATEFLLSYDLEAKRWVWWLNGRPMMQNEASRAGPGLRISVGAVAHAESELHAFGTYELQVLRAKSGWSVFEPSDAGWPVVDEHGTQVAYDPAGDVLILNSGAESSAQAVPMTQATDRRGGAALAIAPGSESIFFGSGSEVKKFSGDPDGPISLKNRAVMTSTVTALDTLDDGVVVGTEAGILARITTRDGNPNKEDLLAVGSGITSVDAGDRDILVGTRSGMVLLVPRSGDLRPISLLNIKGRVRAISSVDGLWALGIETTALGDAGGQILIARISHEGEAQILGRYDVDSAVVALTTDQRNVIAATAGGIIHRVVVADNGETSGSLIATLPGELVGISHYGTYIYVLGRQGEMWVVDVGRDVTAIVSQVTLNGGGAALARQGEFLYAMSRTGTFEVVRVVQGTELAPVKTVRDVGGLSDVVITGNIVVGLVDHRVMEYLKTEELGSGDPVSIALDRRSVALRNWDGGVAAIHGLGGVQLYSQSFSLKVPRLRVVGVSRDVAIRGEHAYVAAGSNGLHVLSLAGGEPTVLATMDTEHIVASVTNDGEILFVGRLGGNLVIVDASDPKSPREIVEIEGTPDVVRTIKVPDVRAVVALGRYGWVYWITYDTHGGATLEWSLKTTRYGLDVMPAHGGLVYVAGGMDGLLLIDRSSGLLRRLAQGAVSPTMAIKQSMTTEIAAMGPVGLLWLKPTIFLPYLNGSP
jgi:hypothetical protein